MNTETTAGSVPLHAIVIRRPGPGWHHCGGSVYEHCQSGMRLHMLGMLRLPCGQWVNGESWPESQFVGAAVRINGGNRKRGLMAWAMNMLERWRIDQFLQATFNG